MAAITTQKTCIFLRMTQRHPVQNDALMFITTNTFQRQKIFSNGAHARETIECLYRVQQLYPFFLYAFVIMPDHCHLLMSVPAPESISRVMNSFKSAVVQSLGFKKVWQPRFHMKIPNNPNETFYYIHQNPVKAGLVDRQDDYPWSSASGKWDVKEMEIDLQTRHFARVLL